MITSSKQSPNQLTTHLIGAGGLGQEIAAVLSNHPDFYFAGFYDDLYTPTQHSNTQIIGTIQDLNNKKEKTNILLSIGNPYTKAAILPKLTNNHLHYPTLIHPKAHLESPGTIGVGEGTIITAGAQLTAKITVGRHVLINLNVTIGHDVTIGDCSSLMPGANISGNVTIGHNVLIGSGATILQGLKIGDNARVGAGAVVTKDVLSGTTVVGIPATRLAK